MITYRLFPLKNVWERKVSPILPELVNSEGDPRLRTSILSTSIICYWCCFGARIPLLSQPILSSSNYFILFIFPIPNQPAKYSNLIYKSTRSPLNCNNSLLWLFSAKKLWAIGGQRQYLSYSLTIFNKCLSAYYVICFMFCSMLVCAW